MHSAVRRREPYGGRPLPFANWSREADDSVLVNGARGTRDIEGKVTRVGASEHGLRASFKTERARSHDVAGQMSNV